MRKLLAPLLALLLCLGLLAGCNTGAGGGYIDGVYTAGFEAYDSYGYRDFVRVTIQGGAIIRVEYDARNTNNELRSADLDYQQRMEKVTETYPSRYSADLVNQLMEKGTITQVDDVAGASWSSACFRALYQALEPSFKTGNTSHVTIPNVPEK